MKVSPGLLVMLGSGETQASSGKVHEFVAQSLPENPAIAILETPAGFELNSAQVAGKIKTFMERRLQNYNPQISLIPARKRGTPFSPDSHEIVQPILAADEVLLGPGSPTYAAKQLRGSLAMEMIAARHRLGTAVFLSSSATLAFGAYTMPVYEIYKVGTDLHWQPGINFLLPYGLSLVVIPHWNNNDGGEELDTSRCYVGQVRFEKLCTMLPPGNTIVGIDEHTAVILDFNAGGCFVMGKGSVTIMTSATTRRFQAGDKFLLDVLGRWRLPTAGEGIAGDVWQAALSSSRQPAQTAAAPVMSDAVQKLVNERQQARDNKEWQRADVLRDQIAALGWEVQDTPTGSELSPLHKEQT